MEVCRNGRAILSMEVDPIRQRQARLREIAEGLSSECEFRVGASLLNLTSFTAQERCKVADLLPGLDHLIAYHRNPTRGLIQRLLPQYDKTVGEVERQNPMAKLGFTIGSEVLFEWLRDPKDRLEPTQRFPIAITNSPTGIRWENYGHVVRNLCAALNAIPEMHSFWIEEANGKYYVAIHPVQF